MNEPMIESADSATPTAESPPSQDGAAKPGNLPEKFWDAKTNQVRLDALIKSYGELERKLGAGPRGGAPDFPEDYAPEIKSDLIASDAELNKKLRAAGLTPEQVQLVYDVAVERLGLLVSELTALYETDAELSRLESHFGGRDRWREVSRQISSWGQSHLPPHVFTTLASSCDGVIAMHRMMRGSEPDLAGVRQPAKERLSESELKQLMRDPRYWREQDPVVVDRVRSGFRRLYQR